MGYMYRYNPAVVLMRETLARGWLGAPFEVYAVMNKVVAPGERRGLAEYPGGIMFALGCHLIDLVVGVLGKPRTVTAFAQHAAKADDGLADNFSRPHDGFKQGPRDIAFPRFTRYVADAADMARGIRGEKPSNFFIVHDLNVQETVLRASDLSVGS